MNRPRFAWFVFGVCLLATMCAAGWLTVSAWRADQARQHALLDSKIQNALWRMDSLAAPLLSIEINRPSLAAPFTNTLMLSPRLVHGYVVRDAMGRWTIRKSGLSSKPEEFSTNCPFADVDWNSQFKDDHPRQSVSDESTVTGMEGRGSVNDLVIGPVGPGAPVPMINAAPAQIPVAQEAQSRSQLLQQLNNIATQQTRPMNSAPQTVKGFAPLRPMWIKGELVLVRQAVIFNGTEQSAVEVCWLNWDEWKTLLSEQLQDLPIRVELRPADPRPNDALSSSDAWYMASLPIQLVSATRLVPGAWPLPLIAVWILLIAVAIAFAWLMRQTLNLSERRAAFVSAVTHELRTPLTTFRLYTEMLSEGLATDPQQQKTYFQTLHREANRLTHMVENVLAYARLERGRSTARNDVMTVAELLEHCRPRLEQRTTDTPLRLTIHISPDAGSSRLQTNATAVEQILFNLIDNTCKYASDAVDSRILCDVQVEQGQVCIRVMDFGPGLSATAIRDLFQPFQKSASQAAESAPGVGLGLALCQRLASDLKGSLRCRPNHPTGLCAVLRLPSMTG